MAAIYFGGLIAAVALIPHILLFAAWLHLVRRWPQLERTHARIILSALMLALPFVIVVFASYAAPIGSLGPFWAEAFLALPWVLLCTWGGILLPRLLVRSLNARHSELAA